MRKTKRYTIRIEEIKYIFTKYRKQFGLVLGIIAIILIAKFMANPNIANFLEVIKELNISNSLIGVIGTLFGAIIGGIISWHGSIRVAHKQQKAQTYIRRKNVIYKPLYDELADMHYNELKTNPHPTKFQLVKTYNTSSNASIIGAWNRIKSDSRYLETPKKIKKYMELYNKNVEEYFEAREKAEAATSEIINDVWQQKFKTSNMRGLGKYILPKLMKDEPVELCEEVASYMSGNKEIDASTKAEIDNEIRTRCSDNESYKECKEKYKQWCDTGEETLEFLGLMIKKIAALYEE